jgi:hypothetical protein
LDYSDVASHFQFIAQSLVTTLLYDRDIHNNPHLANQIALAMIYLCLYYKTCGKFAAHRSLISTISHFVDAMEKHIDDETSSRYASMKRSYYSQYETSELIVDPLSVNRIFFTNATLYI